MPRVLVKQIVDWLARGNQLSKKALFERVFIGMLHAWRNPPCPGAMFYDIGSSIFQFLPIFLPKQWILQKYVYKCSKHALY